MAASKKATLAELLPEVPRERLKEICRELELDDNGRDKARLVERILGERKGASPAAKRSGAKSNDRAPSNGAPSDAAPKSDRARQPSEQIELTFGEMLTVDKLERHLWSAADILRGSIYSFDYKNFIFGLLFPKRLSDRFDEECQAVVKEGLDPDDPDEHEFFVPPSARWSSIQKAATGIGEVLNKACAKLEEKNLGLEGVLAGIDYNDERKLGDAKNRDAVLEAGPALLEARPQEREPLRAGHARARVRVPDREVRGRRRQKGRRVLHPADGR